MTNGKKQKAIGK